MWCEQNKKRTLNSVSHLRVNLTPYCDDTNRAAGLRGWWSRRVASGARVTSCSHSRFEGETIANLSPTLPFTAARTRFRHPDFLGRCSRECTAFLGSLVYCRPPWVGLRSVQYCCLTITLFSFLAFRCCSDGGSSVVSATARWRWAWRVTTRWRARPLTS